MEPEYVIPEVFCHLLDRVLRMDYHRHLREEGRGFIAFTDGTLAGTRRLLMAINLDNQVAEQLMVGEGARTPPNAFGGYFTPARFQNAPLEHEMLYIGTRWLKLNKRRLLAIAFHEACHCYRDSSRFESYARDSCALELSRRFRKFTKYPYEDECGHDDQWFALILDNSRQLYARYPKRFSSVKDAVQCALTGDLDVSSVTADLWASLGGLQ